MGEARAVAVDLDGHHVDAVLPQHLHRWLEVRLGELVFELEDERCVRPEVAACEGLTRLESLLVRASYGGGVGARDGRGWWRARIGRANVVMEYLRDKHAAFGSPALMSAPKSLHFLHIWLRALACRGQWSRPAESAVGSVGESVAG